MILQFRKLRMRQQALIIQGTIIIISLILVSIIIVPLIWDGVTIMRKSSYDALLKSNDAKVSQTSTNIKKLIDLAFLQANLTLNKAQQLYLNKINYSYQLTPSFSKNNKSGYPLAYHQTIPVENINLTSNYYLKYSKLLYQMDSFLLSFHQEQLSNLQVLFRMETPHLTTAFSLLTLPTRFNIEARPYYQEHINQSETRYLGKPFFNQASQILSLMITQTIYDENKNKDLVMGMSFQFDTLNRYLSLTNIKLVLCTQEGIIITSNLNNSSQVQTVTQKTFIFNQSIFPFNSDDWYQLNVYLQNNIYQSNCQQSFVKFCRNLNGSDIQIEATYIQTKFISIIFNDLSFTKSENQVLNNNIYNLIQDIVYQSLAFFLGSFIILIMSSFLINVIIQPASRMITLIERQIQTSLDQIQVICEQAIKNDNLFSKLQSVFEQLIEKHLIDKKSKIALLSQQKYPIRNKNVILENDYCQFIANQPREIRQYNLDQTLNYQECKRQNKHLLTKITQIIQEQ